MRELRGKLRTNRLTLAVEVIRIFDNRRPDRHEQSVITSNIKSVFQNFL